MKNPTAGPISALFCIVLAGCAPTDSPSDAPPAAQASGEAPSSVSGPLTTTATDSVEPARFVPGELLVKYRDGAAATPGKADANVRALRAYRTVSGLRHLKLAAGESLEKTLAALRSRPDVEYAEPNYIYRKQALPDDPDFAQQWGLHNSGQGGGTADADVDAPEAWDITTGASDVVVAVIDSGVDYTHQDLAPNMYRGADCDADGVDDDTNGWVDDCHGIDTQNNDSDPMDDEGHGTHVAGIIAARGNNGMGVAGVAWNARVIACKFIDAIGEGTAADAIACLDYIAALRDRGVNVVATNNSWGEGIYSRALGDAIERQRARGILFIAAGGNADTYVSPGMEINSFRFESRLIYPCAFQLPNVICVASSTRADDLSDFTYHGPTTVHVFAPGEDIRSTLPNQSYGELSGSSMATPFVTGVAALIRASDPGANFQQIRARILASGDTITRDSRYPDLGWPVVSQRRLNAANALNCTLGLVKRRVSPRTAQPISPYPTGVALRLGVMHLNCGGPAGSVNVTVDPGNISIPLHDDGLDGDEFAGDGEYYANWTPAAAGTYTITYPNFISDPVTGNLLPDTVVVEVDAHLKPGFPVRNLHTEGTNFTIAEPVVANIDGAPGDEIVVSGFAHGPIYAIKGDGSIAPGFPLSRNGRMYHIAHFSAGNFVGNDDALELVGQVNDDTTVLPSDTVWPDSIEAYTGDGLLLPNWPRVTENFGGGPLATLVDVDLDGHDEMYMGVGFGRMGAVRHDGSAVPGFGGVAGGFPFAADLDADLRPELVFTNTRNYGDPNSLVIVGQATGTARTQEMQLDGYYTLHGLGDVDGDGLVNIVATVGVPVPPVGSDTFIRILRPDGSLVREFRNAPDTAAVSGISLADLDQDGIPEIVVAMGLFDGYYQTNEIRVAAFKGTGEMLAGWPVILTGGSTSHTPLVGDVDGDGLPEVVVNTRTSLFVINHDGSMAASSPKSMPSLLRYEQIMNLVPAIADIDADGRNDIILTGTYWIAANGWFDRVFAYDLRGPASFGPIEWGQLGGGPQRQFQYQTGKNIPGSAFLTIHTAGDGIVTATGSSAECQRHCLRKFTRNAAVQLTAAPRNGGQFERWLGACAGQAATCTLNLAESTATRAVFSSQRLDVTVTGPGAVTSNLAGIQCPTACSAEYQANEVVVLTATPGNNATFMGWSGYAGCVGTNSTCTVPMTSARAVQARFEYRVGLSLIVTNGGAGGSVSASPAGIDQCTSQCSQLFDYGTLVVLTATATPGYAVRWSSTCANAQGNTCEVLMDQPRTISVSFMPEVSITVTKTGSGSGTVVSTPSGINCGTTCSTVVPFETSLEFAANPAADSVFVGWVSGCGAGGAGNCHMTAQEDTTLTAQFELKVPVRVTIQGSGTVSSLAPGILCTSSCETYLPPDIPLELHATAAAGHLFTGWSGACQGSSSVCMTDTIAARDVTATFVALPVLNVSVTGNGSVGSDVAGITCGSTCSHAYLPGTQVRLTAVPQSENAFAGWGGACAGTSTTCDVTMNDARNVTASFTPWPVLTVTRSGAGAGSVSSAPAGINCGADCTETLSPGTSVTLTATASAGSNFGGWSGECSGTTPTCTVTVSAATGVTANFAVTPQSSSSSSSSGGSKGGGGGGGRMDPAWLALAISMLAWRLRQARRKGVGL